jgi:hypothetical protein
MKVNLLWQAREYRIRDNVREEGVWKRKTAICFKSTKSPRHAGLSTKCNNTRMNIHAI